MRLARKGSNEEHRCCRVIWGFHCSHFCQMLPHNAYNLPCQDANAKGSAHIGHVDYRTAATRNQPDKPIQGRSTITRRQQPRLCLGDTPFTSHQPQARPAATTPAPCRSPVASRSDPKGAAVLFLIRPQLGRSPRGHGRGQGGGDAHRAPADAAQAVPPGHV